MEGVNTKVNDTSTKSSSDENALEELALEEILRDIKWGAERAKEHGALGWQKNPAPSTNKRFLRNMLASTLRDDRPFKRKEFNPQQQLDQHQPQDDQLPQRSIEPDPPFRYNDPPKPNHDSFDPSEVDNPSSFLAPKFNEDWSQYQDDSVPPTHYRSQNNDKKNKLTSSEPSLQQYNDWRHSLKRTRQDSTTDSSASVSNSKERNGGKKGRDKKHKKHHHRRKPAGDEKDTRHKKKHKKSKKSKKSKHKSSKSHKKDKN